MSTITLQNFRVGSDLTVKVRLKDGGVAIDWSTLSGIRAVLYSDAQSSIAGRCDVTVDGEDPTLLVCRYAATKMQYLGVNRIIVSAKYMGETKTYDKPAFTFVRWTADQEGEQITIEDPEVTVEIDVEDVSSSLLDEAIRAAFTAAEEAVDAKGQVLETEAEVEAAEALRVSAEESRVEAEEGRAEAEAARVDEEAVRVSAEDARVVAENARAAAEDLREGAEDDRVAAETARETAEAARVAAEALRVTAEGSREAAEAAREAQASADHTIAAGDHTQAVADHTQAAADHTTAASDHTQAGADHTLATADHVTAGEDHAQAQDDHEVMEGYDTRLGNVESEVSQLEAKVTDLDAARNLFPIVRDTNSKTNQVPGATSGYIHLILVKTGEESGPHVVCQNHPRLASGQVFINISAQKILYIKVAETYNYFTGSGNALLLQKGVTYDIILTWDNQTNKYSFEVNGVKYADNETFTGAVDRDAKFDMASTSAWSLLPCQIILADISGENLYFDNTFDFGTDLRMPQLSKRISDLEEAQAQAETLIAKESLESTSNIQKNIAVEPGHTYRVKINEVTGPTKYLCINSNHSKVNGGYRIPINTGGEYFVPVFYDGAGVHYICLRVADGSEHSVDYEIYKISSLKGKYDTNRSNLVNYSKVGSTLDLSTFFQGYYTGYHTMNNNVGYWCSLEMQFNRGKSIKVTIASGFRAFFAFLSADFTTEWQGYEITSGNTYDTSNFGPWSIQIRRSDYAALTPADAAAALTIEQVSGDVYAMPADSAIVNKAVTERVNASLASTIERITALEKNVGLNPRLGVAELGEVYYHNNPESNPSFVIPSQSLYDIAYAKALGCKVIEGNVHTCSDGVIVVKHGQSGKLGAGLRFAEGSNINADTEFTAVSSVALRANVTYDSPVAKYNSPIPTLDEFCSACASLGMTPYLRGVNAEGLAIARKYLPDERIVVEGPAQRGDFKGMMILYSPATSSDPDAVLAICNAKGAPFIYSGGNFPDLSDADFVALATKLHQNGYLLASGYITASQYLKFKALGLDVHGSITDKVIPAFYEGNTLNLIGCGDNGFILTGATYDQTTKKISMSANDTISVESADIAGNVSKLCLRLVFNGTVDISFGQTTGSTLVEGLTSNGDKEIVIAEAVGPLTGNTVFKVTAKAATEIIDINLYGSVLIRI